MVVLAAGLDSFVTNRAVPNDIIRQFDRIDKQNGASNLVKSL